MRGIVLMLLPLALLAADQAKKPAAPKTKAAVKSSRPAIPPDAVQIGPDKYRYTDKDGKTWIYYRTPFGASRAEEKTGDAKPAPPVAVAPIPVKVSVEGDEVRFERKSPFGKQIWTKNKSELTDEEKTWVAEQQKDSENSANRTKTTEK